MRTALELTERDIYHVLEGRAAKKTVLMIAPWAILAFIAGIITSIKMGDGWIADVIIVAEFFIILALPIRNHWKTFNAMKAEAKQIYQETNKGAQFD